MNEIILRKGNLGADATSKTVGEKTVIEFSVADNRTFTKQNGEKVQKTQWFRCSYWTESKITDMLKKGVSVCVFGQLDTGVYLDKQQRPCADLKVNVSSIDIYGITKTEETKETEEQPEMVDNDLPA